MMKSGTYDARADASSWWFQARRQLVTRIVGRYTHRRDMRVLDVGCGAGGNIPTLSRYGTVLGIDIDPLAVDMATHAGYTALDFDVTKPETLSLGTFDLVTALDVLEHIEDDLLALRHIQALLTSGGLCLVSVPAMPSLWSDHDRHLGHVRRYTAKELAVRLKASGLKVKYLTAYGLSVLPGQYAVRRLIKQVNGTNDVPKPLDWILRAALWAECGLLPPCRFAFGPSLIGIAGKE